MGSRRDRPVHPDLAGGAFGGAAVRVHGVGRALARTAVGPLDRDHGLGARGQRGARHDAGGLPRPHGLVVGEPGAARGHVADDGEHRGELLARALDVGHPDRVPVHGAVVEGRQGHLDDDVLDEDAPLGVGQLQLDGLQRTHRGEDVVQVLVDRPDPAAHVITSPRRRTCAARSGSPGPGPHVHTPVGRWRAGSRSGRRCHSGGP